MARDPTMSTAPQRLADVRLVVGVVSVLAAGCVALGLPSAWLVLSVAALAVALCPTSFLDSVPLAFVMILASVAGLLLAAGALSLQPLHTAASSGTILLAVNGGTAYLGWRLGGDRQPVRPWCGPAGWALLGYLPFTVMCVLGVVSRVTQGAAAQWFLSGDHLRHLAFVTRMWASGALEYSTQSYPRAWHAIIAAPWAVLGPERDPSSLERLIVVHSTTAWCSLACLTLVLSTSAIQVHRLSGASSPRSALSGLVAGSMFLAPAFLGAHATRGFETSLVAVLVIAVAAHQVALAPASRRALGVSVLAAALVAQVWQLLLPAAAAVTAVAIVSRWRTRARVDGAGPADLALVTVGALAALPGLWAAATAYGVSAVSTPGDVPPAPWGWATVALVAVAWVMARDRLSRPATPLVMAALAAAATSLALVMLLGLGLDDYYPNKALWSAVVLALPLLAIATTEVVSALDGLRQRLPFLLAGVVAGVGALYALAAPAFGVFGGWGSVDGGQVVRTVTAPEAARAVVVWSAFGPDEDATSQLLLDFYTAEATTPPLGLAVTTREGQCDLLSASTAPTAISTAEVSVVLERFRCAGNVATVRPAGPP